MQLFWTIIRLNLAGELAYRANFWLQVLQSLLSLATALAGLLVIFGHTSTLAGWSADELLALFGVYMFIGGLIDFILQPALQQMMNDMREGTFDFVLLKPVDAQLFVSIQRVRCWKCIDVTLGLLVLSVALSRLGLHLTFQDGLLFLLALLAGGAIIYSFWLLLASCVFWLVRVESMLSIFQNMYQAGRWPLTLYPAWLRLILLFIIPVGVATTIPVEALTGMLSMLTLLMLCASAGGMLVLARVVWRLGIRSYT